MIRLNILKVVSSYKQFASISSTSLLHNNYRSARFVDEHDDYDDDIEDYESPRENQRGWSNRRQYTRNAPLGDQKAYYREHLRKQLSTGNDTHFNIRNYENSDESIRGFGRSYQRPQVSGFGGRPRKFDMGENLQPIDFMSTGNLNPIHRDFYKEHADVAQRSQAEIDEFWAKHEIKVKGTNVPRPVLSFAETNFPQSFIDALTAKYDLPTTIQSVSWPIALSGHDLISIGRTGSGKTLSFILPALIHTMNQKPARKRGEGPSVLVLCPTRELAQQVEEVTLQFSKLVGLQVACCFGGASKNVQSYTLQRGVDIVIATPGRIIDFLESGTTNLRRCSYLVLDEADRMLDMGFEPQIRKIFSQIRPDRQSLMFSATWPEEVRALAADFQSDPIFVNIGSAELSANHNIKQSVLIMEEKDKESRLLDLLTKISKEEKQKTLIFVETKRKADYLTRKLRLAGFAALSIHGDKSQTERNWVLNEFRSGNCNFLLATDVAARGLDVNDIEHVINVDYPHSSKDYVHRIGRTGRGDKTGSSHTFFTEENQGEAAELIKVLEEANQEVPQELMQFVNYGSQHNKFDRYGKNPPQNFQYHLKNKNKYRQPGKRY